MQHYPHVGFLYNFVSSAQAKVHKFDFRIRGLVAKSANQTSSRIMAN